MYITGTYKVWITQKVGDISQDFTWVLTPSKICETHTTLDEFLITEKTVTSKWKYTDIADYWHFKGTVHPKTQLSHVVPNLYEFLPTVEHKRRSV